jgi:hypothetical protein
VGHGGQRAGAGRKAKRIKFAGPVGKLDKKLAAHVEKAAENLIFLANGGYDKGHEVWKPAGAMQIVRTEMVHDDKGNPKILRHLEPMFPDIEDQTTLVCVHRQVEIAEPDRAANEYIIDRIAGRPSQMEEPDDEKKGAKVTEDARKKAMQRMTEWRHQSQEQLASIRNPLTGQTIAESENNPETSFDPESSTTDEF